MSYQDQLPKRFGDRKEELGLSNDVHLLENLRGFNHHGKVMALPQNKDTQGMAFFVRPQLNMSVANLKHNRRFLGLLDAEDISLQTYIRTMLDPRLIAGYRVGNTLHKEVQSTYINNNQAFIPILTNTLVNLTGGPDAQIGSFTRPKGLFGEEPSMIDSHNYIRGQVPINAVFRNTAGLVTLKMFQFWQNYASAVFAGESLTPYPDFLIENELDYNTRIFRPILDATGQYVVDISATGPGFVEGVPLGNLFDYNTEEVYSNTESESSFSFKFQGMEYSDPILIYEFNQTVGIFKPEMKLPRSYKGVGTPMIKVPHQLKGLIQFEGYYHINYITGEFETFIEVDMLDKLIRSRVHHDEVGDIANYIIKENVKEEELSMMENSSVKKLEKLLKLRKLERGRNDD